MAHLDPDLLALLALGEDAASGAERAHLASCARCGDELRRLARPVAAAREDEVILSVPSLRVWTGVVETLGLTGVDADPIERRPAGRRPPAAGRVHRPRRRVILVVAGAAAAVALVLAGFALVRARSEPQRLESAQLLALPDWPGRGGTAVLERLTDGRLVLRLDTTVRADAETDHEVWLITKDARRLISLGFLRGSDGTFAVPAGVDLHRFGVVDVSDEPRDGNAAHSGDSIVRGSLHS